VLNVSICDAKIILEVGMRDIYSNLDLYGLVELKCLYNRFGPIVNLIHV
jgi:hypothetical protein